MADNPSLGKRGEEYRPSQGMWFWSCAACVVTTMVIGFSWGGWVTGGTATRMATDAAYGARAQLAAAACISRFENSPDVAAQLAALKKAYSFERSNLIEENGWVTMPGGKQPVPGAGLICAEKIVDAGRPAANG